ncbi:MAG: associated Golgi protein [Hyphomicrobiales bacterium]|nr:associated Golgi protein [Hyphomicrobiales bacterium]
MVGLQVSLDREGKAKARAWSGGLWTFAPWVAVFLAILVIAGAWTVLPLQNWMQAFSHWVTGYGAAGAIAFGLAYILAMLLLVPGAPMTIAGAIVFGWWGAPLVLVSATTGATLAFLISRFFLRDRLRNLIESRPALKATVSAVDEEGWVALALIRLSPVIPFNVQNYLLGATKVATSTYFASTLAGMIPGTLLSTYLGVLGRAAGEGGTSALQWIFLGLGLAATVAVVVVITTKAREKLARKGMGDRG